MKTRDRIARTLLGLLATAAPVAACGEALADGPTGVVYVQSNDSAAGMNSVFAFRRDEEGSLRPLPGSPFRTGGTGIAPTFALGPFDSDQELIAARDGKFLLSTNGGSDTVAVLKIRKDGSLTPVKGSPFPSGGTNPVSLGLSGDVLTVVNKSMDPGRDTGILPNYATFQLQPDGRLVPSRNPPQTVDAGASPTQALVAPENPLVFGADFFGGVLRSYEIRNGGLIARDAQPLPPSEFVGSPAPRFPLGLAAHPQEPLIYVGFVTINRLGVYRYNANGRLQFLRSVPNSGKAVCWIVVSPDGSRIYTSNTADNSVSVYDASRPAEPREIQRIALRGTGAAFQIALDPDGKFFYVVTQKSLAGEPATSNALHVLSVDEDGKLQEVDSSPTVLPVPEGSRPQGVVAF